MVSASAFGPMFMDMFMTSVRGMFSVFQVRVCSGHAATLTISMPPRQASLIRS